VREEILLECECSGYHFVKIYYDPEWGLCIDHIERPVALRYKLQAVWQVLRGKDIYHGELIVRGADIKKLYGLFYRLHVEYKTKSNSKPERKD